MRVQLIHPPETMRVEANLPPFVDQRRGSNPPLGILYLAAVLRAEHTVEVLDAPAEELSQAGVLERVKAFAPDVVGISTMSFFLPDAAWLARAIKQAMPRTKVAMGGPQPSIYPVETCRLEGVDAAVVGESEESFGALVRAWQDETSLEDVQGIAFANGGDIVDTGLRTPPQELDELPFPARDLTDVTRYDSVLAERGPITVMMTSRGCPYTCKFCTSPGPFGQMRRSYRGRSPENVVDEIEQCLDLGIHEVLIYDDLFTTNRRRAIGICKEILERDLTVRFDIRSTVNQMDAELLGWLKKAGCVRINYGVESGSQDVVDVLDKRIKLERVRQIFRETKEVGIQTLGYFMIGSPGEGPQEIRKTIDFACELNPDYAHFSITTLFPGSELEQWARDRGILSGDPWRQFAAAPGPGFAAPYWTEMLDADTLVRWLRRAYLRFYLRPSYILRRILAMRSSAEVRMKLHAFTRMIRG